MATTKPSPPLLSASTAGSAALTPQRTFVKIEKNLNSLGFFTPARHNGQAPREKVVTVRRELNGRIIEAQATILPSAKYGLPTTADLDKYLAFQKLVEQTRNRTGQIINPFGFTTAQLVNVLGINTTGKNYQDVHDWLQRMTLTGINSKDVVYMAKRRAWMSDTFHVFERVVTVGSVMPDGSVADRNYVWLSEWQLENINGNYLLPVDFETYRQLRNQIAKILVPLLQVWLYASRAEGRFEKRYSELCQILDITCHKHLSLIKRQLEPSLSELQHHGYLSSYSIETTVDGREYKIVAAHGHKFYRDQKVRAALPAANKPVSTDQEPSLLKEVVNRGITEPQARRLLRSIPENHPVLDQLEYADHLIDKAGGKIVNPPGFYTWVLRENLRPPDTFETSAKRRARQEANEIRLREEVEVLKRQDAYDLYCREQVEKHVKGMNGSEYRKLITKHIRQVKAQWRQLPDHTLEEIARRRAEDEIRQQIDLITFERFCANPQGALFD